MRDSKRIVRISNKLIKAWQLVPDWRLGQLVSNLMGPGYHRDIFYTNDETWEALLDRFISSFQEKS